MMSMYLLRLGKCQVHILITLNIQVQLLDFS